MSRFKLTVFTEPVAAEGLTQEIRSFIRPVKFFLKGKKKPPKKKYGGHYAVTRSLIEGLQKTGMVYNYNPSREKDIADHVIVLAGIERLRKMIDRKNKGKIRFLLAGPNVVDDVLSEDQIVADPAIDRYIVPSEWVKRQTEEDLPVLRGRVLCWPVGINTDYWKPSATKTERDQVLIYWKSEQQAFCDDVVKQVKELGMKTLVIRYGDYNVAEYKEQLDRSLFGIFISRSESQGIALTEAWAMDVPTLVFEPGEFLFYGRMINYVSSCPYLNSATGLTWKDLSGLKTTIRATDFVNGFSPRDYVLKQFTDEYCAKQLVKNVQDLQ
jgi:glycosyltransferase involved in cell wall biosynthesis